MKKHILILAFLAFGIAVQAQIPAEVDDILGKCAEKMNNATGIEMDMNLSVKAVVSFNGTIKMYAKGEKSLAKMRMKVLGRDIRTETGNDGSQVWVYRAAIEEGDKDSVFIYKPSGKKKGEYDLDFELNKKYKKAKIKEKNERYEITFTEPKDKEMPKKTTMVVNKSDYSFYQMGVKDGIMGFTMTATKIKYGVSDGVFVLDAKKYPNAVMVKRDKEFGK
jgi:outer membrane lipoprotein-sorting protein